MPVCVTFGNSFTPLTSFACVALAKSEAYGHVFSHLVFKREPDVTRVMCDISVQYGMTSVIATINIDSLHCTDCAGLVSTLLVRLVRLFCLFPDPMTEFSS